MSKRKKVSLKRALRAYQRKGISYGLMAESDYRWLFAAYVKGAFEELSIPEGMEPKEFLEFFRPLAENYGIVIYRDQDNKPLALAIFVSLHTQVIETKIFSLPWTSLMEKVLCSVHFYASSSQIFNISVMARNSKRAFLNHMASYGVLSPVGVIKKAFEDEEDGVLMQGHKVNTKWVNPLKI